MASATSPGFGDWSWKIINDNKANDRKTMERFSVNNGNAVSAAEEKHQ